MVEIDGVAVTGFTKVEIPKQETQAVQYREGNDPDYHRNLWGRSKFGDLTLERGAKKDDTKLYEWRKKVNDGKMDEARKTVAVVVWDEMMQPQLRWEFSEAWPKSYEPPTLDAATSGGSQAVATEKVVVAYDELQRKK
jgi:phage tail-like protein